MHLSSLSQDLHSDERYHDHNETITSSDGNQEKTQMRASFLQNLYKPSSYRPDIDDNDSQDVVDDSNPTSHESSVNLVSRETTSINDNYFDQITNSKQNRLYVCTVIVSLCIKSIMQRMCMLSTILSN